MATIRERLVEEHDLAELRALTPQEVIQRLTPDERHVLATEHLSFDVDAPVSVSILWPEMDEQVPYWLAESGYVVEDATAQIGGQVYETWRRDFEAGHVGVGVNSFGDAKNHYIVLLAPKEPGAAINIENMYPGIHTLGAAIVGERPYVDADVTIDDLDPTLQGQALLRTSQARRNDARVIYDFLETKYWATSAPDQVVLTWSDDPKTTQTIQWRTNPNVERCWIQYAPKPTAIDNGGLRMSVVEATLDRFETPEIANDPVVHRFTATLHDLQPSTTYLYLIFDGTVRAATEIAEFTTAPAEPEPFSFIYMGDAQNGLDQWGTLLRYAYLRQPNANFYIMAGDLVNRGNDRDDWDEFFWNADGVFDRRTLVPILGNHEYQRGHPTMYLRNFTLPNNGPQDMEPEHAYTFEYSNAMFLVLDSNLPPETQAAWADEQLAKSDAKWKFAVLHHPAFSSHPSRNNEGVRQVWTPIFDKHHVDMVLQGHDHAYLRTYPMRGLERADSTDDGTVYIVSVSGVKMYEQGEFDYTAFGMTNVATYQLLDIEVDGDRLEYRAYDLSGEVRDEFVITK